MPIAPTIFLSAFLLFVVQLILGKFILPWFGGAPAVWTTCMLFFQVLLLLGYAYAHLLSARFSPRNQARLHISLLLGSVALLGLLFWKWHSPILPSDAWKPASPERPVWQILRLLGVSVGFPFFILSSTSPLLQRWFSLRFPDAKPYRLYALSNFGSLLGLLGYPFLIEPLTRVSAQGLGWGILYVLFAAACGICAVNLLRAPRLGGTRPAEPTRQEAAPSWQTIALWLLLTITTSSMFLSATNNLCQDVAVVPFLWVLPLTVYLLTFILCFESDRWYRRRPFVIATAIASLIVLVAAFQSLRLKIPVHVISYTLFLFLFCMTCHGELARLRPGPRYLTFFYLTVALGGALGGVFVGLIAPLIFKSYWEFHIAVMTGWIMLAIVFARDKGSFFYRGDRWQFATFVFLSCYTLWQFGVVFTPLRNIGWLRGNLFVISFTASLGFAALVAALFWRRPLGQSKYWPRLLAGLIIFFAECFMLNRIRSTRMMSVDVTRNFYGVVQILHRFLTVNGERLPLLQLNHGQITHGIQIQDPVLRNQPVSYYSTNSGIALALRFHPRRREVTPEPVNIGVLGLGAGTMAGFAQEQDAVRFYEINPAVIAYSLGPQPAFTYARDSKGTARVILGDARLSLQRELNANTHAQFDILAMDAFSGDSVPVHLLTREAFEIYLRHMRDQDGIIAVNISNRFLDLRDLMFGVARHFGLHAVIIDSRGDPPDMTPSRWCLLTRNDSFVQQKAIQERRQDYQPDREILWTDDFSNLFQLLR